MALHRVRSVINITWALPCKVGKTWLALHHIIFFLLTTKLHSCSYSNADIHMSVNFSLLSPFTPHLPQRHYWTECVKLWWFITTSHSPFNSAQSSLTLHSPFIAPIIMTSWRRDTFWPHLRRNSELISSSSSTMNRPTCRYFVLYFQRCRSLHLYCRQRRHGRIDTAFLRRIHRLDFCLDFRARLLSTLDDMMQDRCSWRVYLPFPFFHSSFFHFWSGYCFAFLLWPINNSSSPGYNATKSSSEYSSLI